MKAQQKPGVQLSPALQAGGARWGTSPIFTSSLDLARTHYYQAEASSVGCLASFRSEGLVPDHFRRNSPEIGTQGSGIQEWPGAGIS